MEPEDYGIPGCPCGNVAQYSEYVDKLWCSKCCCDFTPEHWGIFDGPIPVNITRLLGISFDRINLETNEIEPFEF